MVSLPAKYDLSAGHGDSYASELLRTRRLETECRYIEECLKSVLTEVIGMEVSMGMTVP